jgi:hypothetical protein
MFFQPGAEMLPCQIAIFIEDIFIGTFFHIAHLKKRKKSSSTTEENGDEF